MVLKIIIIIIILLIFYKTNIFKFTKIYLKEEHFLTLITVLLKTSIKESIYLIILNDFVFRSQIDYFDPLFHSFSKLLTIDRQIDRSTDR